MSLPYSGPEYCAFQGLGLANYQFGPISSLVNYLDPEQTLGVQLKRDLMRETPNVLKANNFVRIAFNVILVWVAYLALFVALQIFKKT